MSKNKILVVQPTTYELNISGICFAPYWLYAALRKSGRAAYLLENATLFDFQQEIEKHKDAEIVIDISSYPQIELALAMWRLVRTKAVVSFTGYRPLIGKLGLAYYEGARLEDGILSLMDYSGEIGLKLVNDCDNHVPIDDPRYMVPLFLSTGCKRSCPYCYVGTPRYPFVTASVDECKYLIDWCAERDLNIHFSDENFLKHPHIQEILEHLASKSLRYICLSDTLTLVSAHQRFGNLLKDSGIMLCEVGLETTNASTLGKVQADADAVVATGVKVFWLTMTFLPHETLSGLNETGRFLAKYGYAPSQVLERVRTNSTEGGLGQFFQIYDGTEYAAKASGLGEVYTQYPTRLYPSFIGHKLLLQTPEKCRDIQPSDERWFGMYVGREIVERALSRVDGKLSFKEIMAGNLDIAIALAQLARLNIIREKA